MPDEIDWHQVAKDHYDDFDHPLNPDLKVRDFATAVQLASATKFGGNSPSDSHASAQEAGLFWKEFSALDPPMNPQQYLETLDKLKHLSFRLHGRPPTMSEINVHRDSDPKAVRSYFEALPATHWGHPDIPAGDFVKAHTRAEYWSQQHLSRQPYAHEVAMLHHAGMSHQDTGAFYGELRQDRDTRQRNQQPPEATPSAIR